MTENRCDCKPQNIELVRKTRDNMPDYRKISDLSDFFKVKRSLSPFLFESKFTICE